MSFRSRYTDAEKKYMIDHLAKPYSERESFEEFKKTYSKAFPSSSGGPPPKSTLHGIAKRYYETGSTDSRAQTRTVRTPKNMERLEAVMRDNPKLSCRQLGKQLGISKTTVQVMQTLIREKWNRTGDKASSYKWAGNWDDNHQLGLAKNGKKVNDSKVPAGKQQQKENESSFGNLLTIMKNKH